MNTTRSFLAAFNVSSGVSIYDDKAEFSTKMPADAELTNRVATAMAATPRILLNNFIVRTIWF